MSDERHEPTDRLIRECADVLRGHDLEYQAVALAHLVAGHIAAHQHRDDAAKTIEMHRELLEMFLELVVKLIPVLSKMVAADVAARRNPPQ